jgi:hypothetical protein
MKTEDLIKLLAADGATPRRGVGFRLAWAALASAAIAAAVLLPAIGLRPNLATVMSEWRFLLKVAVSLGLAVSAAVLALRLSRPIPAGDRIWLWLLPAPLALALASFYELAVMPSGAWSSLAMGHNALACLIGIPLFSALPLGAVLWALREGAPDRPAGLGAAAGAVAAGIGAALYALHCPDDSPLFLALWYTLAAMLVVAAGRAGGARLLRW